MGKFCTNCGSQIEEGQVKCQYCGKEVGGVENTQTTQTTQTAQQTTYTTQQSNVVSQPKSKIAAGILGILLGALGVHNFYLGYTGKAVAQLLITLLSCGILSFVSAIWGLIEGICILTGSITTDAKGVPLQD